MTNKVHAFNFSPLHSASQRDHVKNGYCVIPCTWTTFFFKILSAHDCLNTRRWFPFKIAVAYSFTRNHVESYRMCLYLCCVHVVYLCHL